MEKTKMIDFTFYTPETASDTARPILEEIEKGYGFIPNLFAYMAEAPTTLKAYLALNQLVGETSLTPAQQQIALLAASVENTCEFCTVAHHAIGTMNKASAQTLSALANGERINDPQDAELVAFTQSVVKYRGRPDQDDIDAFISAGFSKQQIFEVMMVVSIKTLSNYINHLTQPEPNAELLAMIEQENGQAQTA